jgi:hypothetical protein
VRAQQPGPMRRIGVLMNVAADDRQGQRGVAAFLGDPTSVGLERRSQCAN